MPRASEIDGSQYGLFFASAGHAALIDYPKAKALQEIAEQVWANGRVVAYVCHVGAIFSHILDRETGEPIIRGKKVTEFTTEAEYTMEMMPELRGWGSEMMEEVAIRLGTTCKFQSSYHSCSS